MEVIYPTTGANGLWVFVLVTLVIGGAAALATGRAVAATWRPAWTVVPYAVMLTLAVRFLQYALFRQPFLAPGNLAVDALVLLALALTGYRIARARQMTRQYPWVFERAGPFSWRRRGAAGGER